MAGHLTGFAEQLVLPALADGGFLDEAYLMLLRRECPSWLYQVERGATTVWERWDAIRPDGSIHPGTMATPPDLPQSDSEEGHMLSFNHYAYGAVIDWVYRHVAGLSPDAALPAYRRVVFAPKPAVGVDWARAFVESTFGTVAIDWRIVEGGALSVDIDLPFGTSGVFVAPAEVDSRILIDGRADQDQVSLGPGHHTVTVTQPHLAAPPAALAEASPAIQS